ncbi:MAG: PD-(D/E)XK nuclease family protein [Cyanothece sp. SIO1E1]|nr:PD-(D/E)XK nuclease family protein [Cyanothece sp. SIO1E1]
MAYHLSAAKLQTYYRCNKAYYFRYERGIQGVPFFGSAALGTALHLALAQIYWDWHYQDPIPDLAWINHCWAQQTEGLSPTQINEGEAILKQYYGNFIVNQRAIRQPLAVEGRIQGGLQIENLEFILSGRYDRLDWLEDGLELIDYKSTKEIETLEPVERDLQIGLYYLALEQKYKRHLKRLSLIYLRTGEKLSFDVTPDHKQRVEATVGELALKLRQDQAWEPKTSQHCDRCAYSRYCPAMNTQPDPLPADAKPEPMLQLTLSL